MSTFEFDEGALNDFLGGAVKPLLATHQEVLDALMEQYRGRPVGEIKPVLSAAWNGVNDGHISEPGLSEWAQYISEGMRIVIRPGDLG